MIIYKYIYMIYPISRFKLFIPLEHWKLSKKGLLTLYTCMKQTEAGVENVGDLRLPQIWIQSDNKHRNYSKKDEYHNI